MRTRRGFTLIEVLIAVVLIDVGLLALAAGSAVLVRRTITLRARAAAVAAATNRLQLLGVLPCIAASGSAAGVLNVDEHWQVVLQANGVREVNDSVAFATGGGSGWIALRTRLPC